jgi:hypothetical protein
MQEHFRRIWNGYLAFKFVGGDEWVYRFTNPPNLYDQMIAMFGQKRHFAQLNHGRRRFGPNSINDFFDEPEQFLQELVGSDLITRGDAKASRIFSLMAQTGPMLKVFTPRDRELWAEWINSLPRDPAGGALAPADAMVVLINDLASRGMGVPQHGTFTLTGDLPDDAGGQATVTQPVSWWFQLGRPALLMAALADARNGWIIPGNASDSRLVQELLSGGGRMARFLQNTIPELGNKSARTVILDWINAGCPLPAPPAPAPVAAALPRIRALAFPRSLHGAARRALSAGNDYAREVVVRSAVSRPLSAEQRAGQRRRPYGPGGGAPH